jgi:predicted P-loop ATPase
MRGHLIAEISELRGINSRDEQSIKAFITRTQENWVPKYQEHDVSYKRRTFFIGTTNETTFLSDRTGNRRWLPIEVGKVEIAAIKRDCYQLWAEARDTYHLHGIQWQIAQELAKERHQQYLILEPWEEPIREWIERNGPSNLDRITTNEALIDCLQFDVRHITKGEQMRMANVFKVIGLVQKRDSQSTFWTYKNTDDQDDEPLPF